MKYNMQLTPEQADILNGKKGETMAKVMETLVMFGDIFGAKRMVEVTHKEGHLVTSFGIGLLKPLYKTMDRLIADGIKTQGTFTVDPRPLDRENVKYSLLDRLVNEKVMYSQQKHYEEQLKAVGLKDANAFTCACYLDEVGNVPKKGDILSWAESSAVVYANSVLGARCNRNSGMLDLFGSIVGYVPEFGLLTDEGRKATWIVKVETTKIPEAQILGSAIGMKVVEDVPYVYGLDKWIGSELTDEATSKISARQPHPTAQSVFITSTTSRPKRKNSATNLSLKTPKCTSSTTPNSKEFTRAIRICGKSPTARQRWHSSVVRTSRLRNSTNGRI